MLKSPIKLEGKFAGKFTVEFGILYVEDESGFVEPVKQSAFSDEDLDELIEQLEACGWVHEVHYNFTDIN
jgi:hypothetical protein